MRKVKHMLLGAVAGSLLASTLALLGNKNDMKSKLKSQAKNWANLANNFKENIDDLRDATETRRTRGRKSFAKGAFLGLLLGVGTAALLTPKSGKQLRKNLTQGYHDVADKTSEVIHFINENGHQKPLKKISAFLAKKKRSLSKR